MAYPSPFLRLVLSGPLFTTESWSFGLSLMPNFNPSPTPPASVPAGIISAAQTFMQAGSIGSRAELALIKLNEVGVDGRYTSDSDTVLHEFLPPVQGTSATGQHPPQIALAVTLATGASRGLAARGRIYLPSPLGEPANNGQLPDTVSQTAAQNVATFINAINAALPSYRVAVASDVRAGAFRAVETVECGRVLDTIRSRRTTINEARVVSTVAVTP